MKKTLLTIVLAVQAATAQEFSGRFTAVGKLNVSTSSGIGTVMVVSTNTQALLTYTAPNTNACTVEVSEEADYSPVVHDVNPALFTDANSDGGGPPYRNFVAGKRLTATALNAKNYSRSLRAYATHYYRVTCGTRIMTGQFNTANIPVTTYQDIPQTDPANPGSTLMPTLEATDRSQVIYDPHTGAVLRRVSLAGDSTFTGPAMYSGGFVKVCGESLVGPGPGYLCGFSQGNGGNGGALYYIIPSTNEARYVGRASWTTASPYINAKDGKFYNMATGNLIAYTYTGNYAPATTNMVASFSNVTILTGVAAAIQTFNPAFDPTYFTCYGQPVTGDYFNIQCRRANQDTYGWLAIVKISTGSVIAAAQVYNNIKTRWCGVHQTLPMYDQPALVLTTHSLVGGGLGEGPYENTYTGAGTLSNSDTILSVSGEPTCATCGADPAVPIVQVGDTFKFMDGGTSEKITVVTKTDANNWVISRGSWGTTPSTHAPGARLQAACSFTPVFWKFLDDPNGTDATNAYYVLDSNWPVGGHDDYVTGLRATESTGWMLRVGDLVADIGQPATRTVSANPTFAGKLGQCYGNGCKAHLSAIEGQPWILDYFGWDGAYTSVGFNKLQLVTGQLYRYIPGSVNVIRRKHYATAAAWFANFLDVSGPGVVLATDATDNNKYCVANAADECYAGSVAGNVYVNISGSPNLNCNANTTCIVDLNAYAQTVVQIAIDGTKVRALTGGLAGLRATNDYPNAKGLPDGSKALFPLGKASTQAYLLTVDIPPFTIDDSVDRTTFVRASVSIATPQGQGIETAAVEFGYLEQGTAAQHYCTSRDEACVAVSSTVDDAVPFYFAGTDVYTRLACASSCTITLPVLPAHVAYYQVKFYDSGGAFVQNGASGVAVEGTVR